MPKTRQQHKSTRTLNQYFTQNTKKQKKQNKETIKQVEKNKQSGQVGIHLRRILTPYRANIMKEFHYQDLAKQIQQFIGAKKHNLDSILYLSITRVSTLWSEIYSPDMPQDFLDDKNYQYILYWLKNSYAELRNNRGPYSDDSDNIFNYDAHSLDDRTKCWHYRLLNIYGNCGKLSTLNAICKFHKIDVIFTFEYTDKKSFEELFQSEKIKFGSQQSSDNDMPSKRKLIIHRGQLPKLFNQIIKDQRVPLIWLTDTEQNWDMFDKFNLIQYSHDDITNYILQILLIEQNYYEELEQLNECIKENVIFENLEIQGSFYTHFQIPKPKIQIGKLYNCLCREQLSQLVVSFKGNMRSALNFIQFHYDDDDFKLKLLQQSTQQTDLEYLLKNQLPFTYFDKYSAEDEEEEEESRWWQHQLNISDQIQHSRKQLLISHYKPKAFLPAISNIYTINQTLKLVSFSTTQSSRLRKLAEFDPYKPLNYYFPNYERFKLFDQQCIKLDSI